MKKFIVIILFINFHFMYSQIIPGGNASPKYNESKGHSGKFVFALGLKAAKSINDYGVDLGGKAGIMATNNLFVGFSLYTLLTHNVDFNFAEFNNKGVFLRLGYAGLDLEFVQPVFNRTCISAGSFLGVGTINLSGSTDIDASIDAGGDWIFLAEPYAGISFRVYDSFWLGLNAAYRIAAGVDYHGMKSEDMSGPVFIFTIKSM